MDEKHGLGAVLQRPDFADTAKNQLLIPLLDNLIRFLKRSRSQSSVARGTWRGNRSASTRFFSAMARCKISGLPLSFHSLGENGRLRRDRNTPSASDSRSARRDSDRGRSADIRYGGERKRLIRHLNATNAAQAVPEHVVVDNQALQANAQQRRDRPLRATGRVSAFGRYTVEDRGGIRC